MPWTQESSGVISLSSAGSWIANILNRNLITKAGVNLNAVSSSVGATFATNRGSDRVQYDMIVNE